MLLPFYRFYGAVNLDGLIVFTFLSIVMYSLCHPKKQTKYSALLYVGCSVLSYLVLYTSVMLIIFQGKMFMDGVAYPYWYHFLCNIVLALFWSMLLLKGDFFIKLVYVLFYIALVQLYKMAISPLYTRFYEIELNTYILLDLSSTLLSYILLFCMTLVFRNKQIRSYPSISFGSKLAVLYIPISLLLGCMFATLLQDHDYAIVPIIIAVISDLPIMYLLFTQMVKSYEDKQKLDEALMQSKAETAKYIQNINMQEQLRQERHELKNNYFYLQTLLKNGDYQKLEESLTEIAENVNTNLKMVDSGNLLLDYLITQKMDVAKERSIHFITDIALPNKLTVDEYTLFTVLSNLLNNAIEAEEKEEEKQIFLHISQLQNYLVCRISNRVSSDVIKEDPLLHSTKNDAKNHGFGLKIVHQSIKKCNGILSKSVENGYFVVKIMIPIQTLE